MGTTALVVIDLQNDYFPAGRYPLAGIEAASDRAAALIAAARTAGIAVVHVRHVSEEGGGFFEHGTPGAEIHASVRPIEAEAVVVKENVNAFKDTDLEARLKAAGADGVVIAGAMSHMCVDAATRAALDLGYAVTVAHDATATRDLTFGEATVPAAQVQTALMAALEFAGARVVTVNEVVAGWRA